MNEDSLFSCLSWNKESNCCNAIYNSQISKKYPLVSLDLTNFDLDCKGKSNKSRCVAFRGIYLSARELAYKQQKELEVKNETEENITITYSPWKMI
jgi:hypothetical protein